MKINIKNLNPETIERARLQSLLNADKLDEDFADIMLIQSISQEQKIVSAIEYAKRTDLLFNVIEDQLIMVLTTQKQAGWYEDALELTRNHIFYLHNVSIVNKLYNSELINTLKSKIPEDQHSNYKYTVDQLICSEVFKVISAKVTSAIQKDAFNIPTKEECNYMLPHYRGQHLEIDLSIPQEKNNLFTYLVDGSRPDITDVIRSCFCVAIFICNTKYDNTAQYHDDCIAIKNEIMGNSDEYNQINHLIINEL